MVFNLQNLIEDHAYSNLKLFLYFKENVLLSLTACQCKLQSLKLNTQSNYTKVHNDFMEEQWKMLIWQNKKSATMRFRREVVPEYLTLTTGNKKLDFAI